jgi:hypothetical protein
MNTATHEVGLPLGTRLTPADEQLERGIRLAADAVLKAHGEAQREAFRLVAELCRKRSDNAIAYLERQSGLR